MSRHLNSGMRGVLLDAVAERLLTPTEQRLDTAPIDRLAYATMALLHAGGFEADGLTNWLGRFDRVLSQQRSAPRDRPPAARVGNTIGYLRALHLQLLLGVRGLAARDDEAHFDGDVPLRRPLLTSLEDLLRDLQDYYRPRQVETAESWLADEAAARDALGLRRRLRPRDSRGNGLLDLAGNDYLGLSRHSEVETGAVRAARNYGAGSTGSRLVTGTTDIHARLERELADFVGVPAALVFSSGYLANLGAVTALTGPGALVVSDARNHASLVDACRLSRARVVVVPHGEVEAVAAALSGRTEPRALVVTDGVFSVDGDVAPLRELADVVHAQDGVLLVDDAHGSASSARSGRARRIPPSSSPTTTSWSPRRCRSRSAVRAASCWPARRPSSISSTRRGHSSSTPASRPRAWVRRSRPYTYSAESRNGWEPSAATRPTWPSSPARAASTHRLRPRRSSPSASGHPLLRCALPGSARSTGYALAASARRRFRTTSRDCG